MRTTDPASGHDKDSTEAVEETQPYIFEAICIRGIFE